MMRAGIALLLLAVTRASVVDADACSAAMGATCPPADVLDVTSENELEAAEEQEVGMMKLELLQTGQVREDADASVSGVKRRVSKQHASDSISIEGMPPVAWRAFEALAEEQRALLEVGSAKDAKPRHPHADGSVFEAVEVSLPLEPPILKHPRDSGDGQGDKNIVGLHELTSGGRKCVVYGIGIADDSDFEQEMQKKGCETHAFDCSVDAKSPAVAGKDFKFHNWCIGTKGNASLAGNVYVKKSDDKLKFKTLSETMKELGHTYIDLLKFDIEGFEWQLFKTEILTSKDPPEQLSFELHTKTCSSYFCPPENVHDKGYVEVNQLFSSLYDIGYRVTSKELNNFSKDCCAEFVAVNVHKDDH